MKTLSIANCKGGSGKTTTAVNLATELGGRGHRILVIDLDPQGHAGLGFGITADPGALNAHTPLRGRRGSLRDAVRTTGEENVALIPADRYFDGQFGADKPRCLADAIAPLASDYDLVLLDVPPSAAALAVCALMASDGVVVPTTLDPLGLEGARQFARAFHGVMVRFAAARLGLAVAPMRIDLRTNVEREALHRLRTMFGLDQMMRGIRTDVAVNEAFACRRPLRSARPRSRATVDFTGLADDVVRRFDITARKTRPLGRVEGFERVVWA